MTHGIDLFEDLVDYHASVNLKKCLPYMYDGNIRVDLKESNPLHKFTKFCHLDKLFNINNPNLPISTENPLYSGAIIISNENSLIRISIIH